MNTIIQPVDFGAMPLRVEAVAVARGEGLTVYVDEHLDAARRAVVVRRLLEAAEASR